MAERSVPGPDPRLVALAAAYRGIERQYAELLALSMRQHALLQEGAGLADVRPLLERKREMIEAIRMEEERVAEAKSWWTRAKGELPAGETRELLRVLDAVSGRIERALALESECRELLSASTGFRAPGAARTGTARLRAVAAYGRGTAGGAR